MEEEIELKWYEKKQGITLEQKKERLEKKLVRKQRREDEREKRKSEDAEAKPLGKEKRKARGSSSKKSLKDGKKTSPRESAHSPKPPRNLSYKADNIGYLFDLSSIDSDGLRVINGFEGIVDSIYPLTSKQRALLPNQIRALQHELTDEREERWIGYMNETTALSAYVHYYLWWNVVRLTRVFANLPADFFNIGDGSVCLDIGSGPLTVPIAIFLSRPELRGKRITWYCLDISAQALNAGENIFLAAAAALKCQPWQIVRVKGELGTKIKDKVDFLTCANVFNEILQNDDMPPDYLAKKYALSLLSYIERKNDDARIFVAEPGVPSNGRFVSLLRSALMKRHFYPIAPCAHCSDCPMDGKRGGKWCNFSFSTEDAPQSLRSFSRSVYIPKEKAVLSFIAAEKRFGEDEERTLVADRTGKTLAFRITSDPIRLPGDRTGYYACSRIGLLLVVTDRELRSGECLETYMAYEPTQVDEKSGALVLNLAE